MVIQVAYRNDGLPFRPQDWSRLRKIAEGNPDVSKVGAFGVGAYTMFSICEEPLVVSGGQAMAFSWKGDALWVRLADSPAGKELWTSFVLPSRDPYPLPDLVEFGQFLCTSLTFTNCLTDIRLYVDDVKRMSISKRQIGKPTIISPPKASSWWSRDGAVTTSPKGIFELDRSDGAITETTIEMSVSLGNDTAKVKATYISALANTHVPSDMAKKMERVTKKKPPTQVKVEIFIDADASAQSGPNSGQAAAVTEAFAPKMGSGRVFIGFRTSQTTGLAAHLAAPLLPTVEREAIDFQDPILRIYNFELLSIAGILMRLTLEHSMNLVGVQWLKNEPERIAYEKQKKSGEKDRARAQLEAPENREAQPASQASDGGTSSILRFARFMSSGVKKIADVIASADFLRDDDEDLLRPSDSRPLSQEELEAILLMRSFSPQQSTPDDQVGTIIAEGFEKCFPGLTPPVLTSSGVVRGMYSRLPRDGIEGFVERNVVRSVVLKNAKDYLLHVAGCRDLSMRDLMAHLKDTPLEEDELVRILKWWTKYTRIEPLALDQGISLKHNISYFPSEMGNATSDQGSNSEKPVVLLRTFQHYLGGSKFSTELPMPPSVLPQRLHEIIPPRVLSDKAFRAWFSILPFQTWSHFICTHPCLTSGRPADGHIRLKVLATLSREYDSLSGNLQVQMGNFLYKKLSSVRCIPFDGQPDTGCVTDFPKDLYLASAELAIFDGLGSFKKVSSALAPAKVTDSFLVALGVRKTISMDFLFTQLDSLKWNRNPKPLITYLRTVALTAEDLHKLRTTQYLPEVNDNSRTYAPSELYLPNPDLDALPFAKVLQWPSTDVLHEHSPDLAFLKKIGCNAEAPIEDVMSYLQSDIDDEGMRSRALDFLRKRVMAGGPYERTYSNFLDARFLPAVVEDPFGEKPIRKELHAPIGCFLNAECGCLGFPVIDPDFKKSVGRGYTEAFRCPLQPPANRLVHEVLTIASNAKEKSLSLSGEQLADYSVRVLDTFTKIFNYMSSRCTELDKRTIDTLGRAVFIPKENGQAIKWCHPKEIYFESTDEENSELTGLLFLVTPFNPFLATVGVRAEPSTEDILRLLVSSPHDVLEKLGSESKYRSLLRRIAANTRRPVTNEMRNSPFLLAFRVDEDMSSEKSKQERIANGDDDAETGATTATYALAKAEDICIIDNSYFSRLFNVLSAPQESDLERFYTSLGSAYISKKVHQKYIAVGGQRSNTPLTNDFAARIRERRPLLVSNIVSRQLVLNAAALLRDDNFEVFEVSQVKALYTYNGVVKTQFVTCSASTIGKNKLSVFVTDKFDWFHVGNAIGSTILVRCNVQDAFFIGSLLEAPLSQLRARGFPVDRILRGVGPIEQPEKQAKKRSPHPPVPPGIQDAEPAQNGGGFASILQQMFPDCKPEHIRLVLGENPSLDSLRAAADELSQGTYPRIEKKTVTIGKGQGEMKRGSSSADVRRPPSSTFEQGRRRFSKRGTGTSPLSRAIRGLSAGLAGLRSNIPSSQSVAGGPDRPYLPEESRFRHLIPESPEESSALNDEESQRGLEGTLKDSVNSSRSVAAAGISSPEEALISVPENVASNGDVCEVIPAQDLKPFVGPHNNGKTSCGIRVFSSSKHIDSERFLMSKWEMVECFASVLSTLCSVYELRLDTIAIFHEPTGRTIAFNAGRALHFNFRYFASLHGKPGRAVGIDCYSYWFTTMAHELAHNMAIPHAKKHGFFTEAYVANYMPKLLVTLSNASK